MTAEEEVAEEEEPQLGEEAEEKKGRENDLSWCSKEEQRNQGTIGKGKKANERGLLTNSSRIEMTLRNNIRTEDQI